MRSIYTLAAIAALTTAAAAQSPLVTLNAANNGGAPGGAVYFDLTVSADITVTSLDLNCNGGSDSAVDVYVVAGATYVGNQAGGATFWGSPVASGNITTIEPTDTLSNCPISFQLPIGNYAVCVANGAGHAYTNGTGANQQFATAEVQIDLGSGSNTPLAGPTFDPRVWNGAINYVNGLQTFVTASSTASGSGCGGAPFGDGTFYEDYSGNFDLANTGFTLTWNGSGYDFAQGAAAIVAPTGVNTLAFGDDQTQEIPLPFSMPTPAGSNGSVWWCSNGFVSFEATTSGDFSPSVLELLGQFSRLCPLWNDFSPNAGGTMDAEVDGSGTFHLTATDVPEFGTSNASTYQVSLHANGNIEVKYGAVAATDGIVGITSGNGATDPGATDISAAGAFSVATGQARAAFDIVAGARPVTGTTADWSFSGETAGASTVTHVGIPFLGGPIPLDVIFMEGCIAYVDPIVTSPVNNLPIPADPGLLGVLISLQGISAGAYNTTLGVASSSQLDLLIGNL